MKKFIILAATAVVSAIVGAYADKKYNLGIKDRVDGFADRFRRAEKPSEETTTDNESASTEAPAS